MVSKHGMTMEEVKEMLSAVHAQAAAGAPGLWTDGGAAGETAGGPAGCGDGGL